MLLSTENLVAVPSVELYFPRVRKVTWFPRTMMFPSQSVGGSGSAAAVSSFVADVSSSFVLDVVSSFVVVFLSSRRSMNLRILVVAITMRASCIRSSWISSMVVSVSTIIIFEIKLSLRSKKLVRVFNNRLSSLVVRGTVSTLSLHT